ncbi:hypothetical protein [Cellulomonas sp.]|uniref:hypothetical protein n=1 Tax=Cellulomonas sp. TaxID=40001 RepID=UPI003BAD0F64
MTTFLSRTPVRRAPALLAILALGGAPLLGSCAADPTHPPTESSSTESYRPPQESTDPVPEPVAEPAGEVWQWALGSNVWDDPRLARYAADLGAPDTSVDVNANAEGFQLVLDSDGTVVSVVLFNDETALGLPESPTSFRAYPGELPAGLTWSDTADSVVARYGMGTQSGGWGTEVALTYAWTDGASITLGFAATHEAELPGAPLHTITLR